MEFIENRLFDDIAIGDCASIKRVVTAKDIALLSVLSGGAITAPLEKPSGVRSASLDAAGYAIWGASMVSSAAATILPGPGLDFVSQSLNFRGPITLGDSIEITVSVREKTDPDRLLLDFTCANQRADIVIDGEAVVAAPGEKIRRRPGKPSRAVVYERGDRLNALIKNAREGAPLRTAVVHPVNQRTLEGVAGAMSAQLIEPVLVGPIRKIETAAREVSFNLDGIEIIDAPHSHGAAAAAVALARDGKVSALMKGALHTDEIMGGVIHPERGLRTERRVSHVYVIDTPAYEKLLYISDAAINIAPDLEDKRDIVQNAIDLAQALEVEAPKVAILSAVETVYPKLASTVDAAALCKMADRGQIRGGVLDGPLAFDNAISMEAAQAKAIVSPVAGRADILIVPDIEAGNMLAKQLDYLAGAVAAGLVLGARVPIILTSRAEGKHPRIAASAVAKLYHQSRTGA